MYRVVPRTKRGTTKEDEFISTVLYTYISGDDMESLLYHFMDEWLFVFSADPFFIARVRYTCTVKLFIFA